MVTRIPNYLDGKVFSQVMNVVLASSKIQELKLPYMSIRPNFHIILKGYSGSTKSTVLGEVCDIAKQSPIMSLTKASFLGSVDKTTGMFLPPVTWDCRNSILPIDEYSFNSKNPVDRDLLSSLLQVMEKPVYEKPLGYRCNDFKKKNKDLYCIVKDSRIRVKTRFTVFMTTMFSLKKSQSVLVEALTNRCLIVPFYPSINDLERQAKGKTYYQHIDLPVAKNVEIPKSKYLYIVNYVGKNVPEPTAYLRTIGDLCRVFAVLGKHNKQMYELIVALRKRV